ncbi:MAG: 30S ribosomal protein S1 [Chromatiaceae bacterium]|jgi:small subunit ribosomal protein S1|nr:30S ribosomal protein S1 [Chromatiaceae bacterium]
MADQSDFAALLGEFERERQGSSQPDPEVGENVRGTILSITREHAFVELGAKYEGVMDIEALTNAEGQLTVDVGDRIEAVVIEKDEQTGTLLLGRKGGSHLRGGAEIENAYRNRLPVEGRITGVIKGGVEVQIAGVRAFCPASQLDLRYVEEMDSFIGEQLSFRITRYEGGKRTNLVVSRRALLEEEQQALAKETRGRLEVGAVLQGTVTSLKDYGAFVDLGGVEGMIHISELAFGHVKHPQEVLSIGQSVEVSVLRIEQTDNPKHPEKIALSIRALADDPWKDVDKRYVLGTRVRGKVTRLQSFGAFVELEPGVDGLVHISEIGAGRRISHPHEVLNPGDQVEALVLSLDKEKRRIGLSLDPGRLSETDESAGAGAYQDPRKTEKDLGTFGELLKESLDKQG